MTDIDELRRMVAEQPDEWTLKPTGVRKLLDESDRLRAENERLLVLLSNALPYVDSFVKVVGATHVQGRIAKTLADQIDAALKGQDDGNAG